MVASATLFVYFLYFFLQYIHSYIHSRKVHSCFLIALRSVEGLPGVPSRDSNSDPAVQQADALLSETIRIRITENSTICPTPSIKKFYEVFSLFGASARTRRLPTGKCLSSPELWTLTSWPATSPLSCSLLPPMSLSGLS